MNAGRWVTGLAVVMLVTALAWLLFVLVPAWYADETGLGPAPASVETPSPPATPRIRVTLFYVAEGGTDLVETEREIPFGGGTLEQGRRIVEAQLSAPPAPLLSPIPSGTTLRALYVTGRGRAYVDLSAEAARDHPGGSLFERLTVAAIVEALTANLPAISEVQILVDGREVDTLAGHLDLRRAWTRHALWPAGGPTEQNLPGLPAPPVRN